MHPELLKAGLDRLQQVEVVGCEVLEHIQRQPIVDALLTKHERDGKHPPAQLHHPLRITMDGIR